jgi:hypothetical protein
VSACLIALNKIVDREALARYQEVVSPIFPAYVVRLGRGLQRSHR